MNKRKFKVLVTGGSGYIGGNLIRFLNGTGVVSTTAAGRKPCAQEGVENIIVKDLSRTSLGNIMRKGGFDAVIHLAAFGVQPSDRDIEQLININHILPVDVVLLCRETGVKNIIFAGSNSEYRDLQEKRRVTESDTLTDSLYGGSKASGILMALSLARHFQISAVSLRIFNVYGPGEAEHRLSSSLFSSLKKGEAVDLSPGLQIRDFIYIDDVCHGIWKTLLALDDDGKLSGVYNLCTGVGTTVRDFALLFAKKMGLSSDLLKFGSLDMRQGENMYLVGDNALLKKKVGWEAKTTLRIGIEKTILKINMKGSEDHEKK